MEQARYLSVAETAKLVRAALAESFPGVKFSVRSHSYSGGASINVAWTDGPASKLVQAVVSPFQGASFDGMTDSTSYHNARLNGELVHFGANYIFENRHNSTAAIARAIKFLQGKYPGNEIQAAPEQYEQGLLWSTFPLGGDWASTNSLGCMITSALSKISSVAEPAKSATLARLGVYDPPADPEPEPAPPVAPPPAPPAVDPVTSLSQFVALALMPALGGVQ